MTAQDQRNASRDCKDPVSLLRALRNLRSCLEKHRDFWALPGQNHRSVLKALAPVDYEAQKQVTIEAALVQEVRLFLRRVRDRIHEDTRQRQWYGTHRSPRLRLDEFLEPLQELIRRIEVARPTVQRNNTWLTVTEAARFAHAQEVNTRNENAWKTAISRACAAGKIHCKGEKGNRRIDRDSLNTFIVKEREKYLESEEDR